MCSHRLKWTNPIYVSKEKDENKSKNMVFQFIQNNNYMWSLNTLPLLLFPSPIPPFPQVRHGFFDIVLLKYCSVCCKFNIYVFHEFLVPTKLNKWTFNLMLSIKGNSSKMCKLLVFFFSHKFTCSVVLKFPPLFGDHQLGEEAGDSEGPRQTVY